jgi:hypothetical protein
VAYSQRTALHCLPVPVQLSGTLPKVLATMPLLSEVKVEVNDLIGTIPPEIPLMPRLRRFQTEQNAMEGPIPAEFRWGQHKGGAGEGRAGDTGFRHQAWWLPPEQMMSRLACVPWGARGHHWRFIATRGSESAPACVWRLPLPCHQLLGITASWHRPPDGCTAHHYSPLNALSACTDQAHLIIR